MGDGDLRNAGGRDDALREESQERHAGMSLFACASVVNVSSLLALSGGLPPGPLPARAIYAGAKSFILTFTETLAAETISGLRLQALLPGMVATEFGGGYSGETSMSADDVVRASLIALDRGEIVCVPGLDDDTALERLRAARLGVMSGGNRRELSSRYHVAT